MKFAGTTPGMPQKKKNKVKEVKLENFKQSFSGTGTILWNQISPDRRDISKPTFKKNICGFSSETF